MKADHFDARCKKKGYHQYHDPRRIVETATECLWYEDEKGDPTTHGGTPWSVIGLSIEGDVARLGVEAFLSGKDQYVILCSIMQGW